MILATLKKRNPDLPVEAKVTYSDGVVLLENEQGITQSVSMIVFKDFYQTSYTEECSVCGWKLEPWERRVCALCASRNEHAGDIVWEG